MESNKALLLLLHISFVVLIASSSFTVLALNDDILSTNNIAQPPHHNSLPPAPSPKPPHKHRNHHHKHPLAPAPSLLPPKPPTHPSPPPPPPKTPTHPSPPPPPKAPAHPSPPPPPKAPAHPSPPPPPKAPAHPSPPPPKAHTPPPPFHHSPPPPPSPTVPKKKPIAVRGLVYCKYCKYRGIDNLYKSTPIKGAVVKLACSNTKYHLSVTTTTDKNGFFLFYMPKIVSSAGYRKCKVYLVKSPLTQCSVKTNYKLGKAGAPLIPTPLKKPAPYNLYTVGPFAFEPSKKVPCPR